MITDISVAFGQDIEKVMHADSLAMSYWNKLLATDPLVLTGGVSAKLSYSSSANQPFGCILNGNLNTDVFGFKVPLSFTWSNKNFNYQLSSPIKFNRIKLNPQYKWVKLNLGQCSMTFSPYTLSGIQFTGVGVELTPPGGFNASFMKGRIYDAVAYDTLYPSKMPVYQREGNGVKLGFNKSAVFVEASFFEGHDVIQSIILPTDTTLAVVPYQNVAYSFKSRLSPLKVVSLEMEYASSAINCSYTDHNRSLEELLWGDIAGISRYNAYKLSLNFSPKIFQSGLSIEHIDPDFQSLGTYYCRSDFQNITLNLSTNLLNGKIVLAGSGGVEVDNLKNQKQEVNTRTVGSVNLTVKGSEKLDLTLVYSNYQSYSNISDQFDYINQTDPSVTVDTLNYLQVNQNASLNVNYTLRKTKEQSQRLIFTFSLNGSNSSQGTTESQKVQYYNMNAQWASLDQVSKWGLNASFNSSLNCLTDGNTLTLGPILSVRKQIPQKKLSAAITLSYNSSYLDGELSGRNINSKISCSYTFKEINVFTLDVGYINRMSNDQTTQSSSNISLTYALKMKKMKLFKPVKPVANGEAKKEVTDEN